MSLAARKIRLIMKLRRSGITNTAWQLFSTPVTAGVHTLMWSYEKDGSAAFGQDAAWLDAVTLPAFTP